MEYAEREHLVTFGETWNSVAMRYKMSVSTLKEANANAAVFLRLVPGHRLRIPHTDFFKRPNTTGGLRPALNSFVHTLSPALPKTGFSRDQSSIPVPDQLASQVIQEVQNTAPSVPPWMATANAEIGVREHWGSNANPRILTYFEASHFWGVDDSGAENAWCASFVAWVMKQHGYDPVQSAFRARSWANFGKPIDQPISGAIGIKSRRGGGHVAFVVGKNATGEKLYMLGGNQGNKVQISEYSRSVWTRFVVPADYDESLGELPEFDSVAQAAGSEE